MKKIISLLLCVMFITAAFPFGAFADIELPCVPLTDEKEETMPFTDVIEGKWYYNAIETAWKNGYMAGTSDTTFTPDAALTRAMFVTVLATVSGDDLSGISKDNTTGFSDVESGRWYVRAVKWALEKGVAAGMGSIFGVNKPLTREQMAVMICKFAQNGEETISDSFINKYADKDKISSWATESVKFVSKYELMSGTATVNGAPYFKPDGTATRAQAAVVINKVDVTSVNSEYPVKKLTLNGNDIEKYQIVYGKTATNNPEWSSYPQDMANDLAEKIAKITGVTLPVGKDTETAVSDFEILIGETNREGSKVKIDRSAFEKEAEHIEMQGNYLILASDELYKSTYYAIYRFLEECLGYYSMGNNTEMIVPVKEIDVPDGYIFHDAPTAEYRMNYQWNTYTPDLRSGEAAHIFANLMHTLGEFAQPDYQGTWEEHLEYFLGADPCLTNSNNIDNIIRSVKLVLSKRPDADLIWVTQCDSGSYCKCENCGKVFRTWGRCATYIQILQYVSEAIKEEYPSVRIVGLPYGFTHMRGKLYTITPTDEAYAEFKASYTKERYVPQQSLVCPDNVILCVCTDNDCSSHIIASQTCKNTSNSNVAYQAEFQRWSEICSNLYVWDYVNGDKYKHQVFPFVNNFYDNYQFFRKYNVKGFYILGMTEDYSDFSALKTYIVSILNWDYTIPKKEYDEKVDRFLKAYYGEGWTYVKEFINKTDELSEKNEWHIWTVNEWDDIITRADYIANIDYLMGLWNKAISLADTESQKEHCQKGSVQMRYIELVLKYKDYEDAVKAGQTETANALYTEFKTMNNRYRDFLVSIGYDVPSNWTVELSPENWRFE